MQLPSNSSPAPRVLHVSQPVDGGVARVVVDLVRAQRAAGMDVHLACPDGGTLARSVGPVPVHPWAAARSPGPGLRAEVRDLARVVDAVRPTLVHAHSAKAGLAARVAVRGRVPTVFQPHAWSFEAVDGSVALLARTWERHAARWTARTLCVSAAERDTGRRAGIAGPCTIVPNGIDPERFVPGERGVARAELLFGGGGPLPGGGGPSGPDGSRAVDAPWVVCVGRLCRQKGQDVLLRAWPTVVARVPGARLVLVGDGPDAAALRAGLAGAVGAADGVGSSVTFVGAADDTAPWYRAADVVVQPSRWEGMALAPLEAMSCARPVVLTDVDGARESLPPAHHAHALVPPEDPDALAAALTALLRDPALRESLGAQGRAHVLDHHDVRRTATAVEAVYRELLGPAPIEHRECSTT
ncbi:glycosyltransferase [Streptomyces flavofungini]|uniref:glycosyltransferase n=1 Tax=Streptomyces flavofungini TaxID=68200 RepID=UPI0025B0625D|nr:glycosyltransferase [Streptomyces flavofungini]WJV47495.1 glycosyltransferase [Streptomyces flavofungini]